MLIKRKRRMKAITYQTQKSKIKWVVSISVQNVDVAIKLNQKENSRKLTNAPTEKKIEILFYMNIYRITNTINHDFKLRQSRLIH